MSNHKYLLLMILVLQMTLAFSNGRAQYTYDIEGPTSVVEGNTYSYTVTPDMAAGDLIFAPGTVSNQTTSSFDVTYTSTGTYTIKIRENGSWVGLLSVTVSAPPPLSGGYISNTVQTVNYDSIPDEISATSATDGNCGGNYTYQWISSTDNLNYFSISGATGQNYQPPGLTTTTYFKRKAYCGTDSAYTSNTAIVNVYPQIIGGTLSPLSQTLNYNTQPASISLSGTSGGNGSFTYQWQSSDIGIHYTDISGATGNLYWPPVLTASQHYRVAVTSNGAVAYTDTAVVTIYPQLQGGIITPGSLTISYNMSPGILTLSGVSGGNGTYTYQWQSSTDGTNYANVSGATGTSYNPGNLTASHWYRVTVVSNGVMAYSDASAIMVTPVLTAGSISGNTGPLSYDTSPGQLSGTSSTGGNCGSYSYQWQQSTDGGSTWSDISNAIDQNYNPGNLPAGISFRRKVSCGPETLYSNVLDIVVYPELFPGTLTPASITIASGTSPGMLTASAAFGGGCNGSYSYQWQWSTDSGATWTDVSGAIDQNYSPGNLNSTISYRRRVICNIDTVYTNACTITIGTLLTDINYIRVRDITKGGVTDTATARSLTNPAEVKQTTQYFDGLGRLVQTVAKEASPLQKDLVMPKVYDELGREVTKYLPYVSSATNGEYKPNAIVEQNSFNAAQFSGEQFYYGTIVYEASPLNRVQTTYAPGANWVGGNRGEGMQYQVNTVADSVRIWTIGYTSGSIPVTTSTYGAGTLYKTVTTDEDGHTVVEYKDMQNKLILKKVQLSNSPGTAHVGWLCTYYIYDDFNNLRFVLQPRAVELIDGSWSISNVVADELCFRYEYDARKRMTVKKVPGAGETFLVYDGRDRLVMTQDSSLRAKGKWLVTKFDGRNRPDSSGLLTDANNRSYHQALSENSSNYPNTSSNFELLTQTYYDDYSWVTGSGSGLSSSMATTNNSNSNYFVTSYNTSPIYAVALTPYYVVRGAMTGSKTKVLGTANQYLYTASFYDDHGRVIQAQAINFTGAKDTITTQYNFSGQPIRSLVQQHKGDANAQAHSIVTKMNYDAGGRLTAIYKNVDNAASDHLIVANTYNERGQLQGKTLGSSLESLNYDYNIRGWLTDINKDYLAGTGSHFFGMELGYDKSATAPGTTTFANPQYNGNISGEVWKSKGDGVDRKYDFSYDNVNRLTAADFKEDESGNWADKLMDFSVSDLTYDANGNIQTANRAGWKLGAPTGLIDQLTYAYQSNSNKLSQVNDAMNDPQSKLGDFHYTGTKQATDYSYDGNGNLVLDNNKSISRIAYNYLNLPDTVQVTGKGTIVYTYDAAGNKLEKTTIDNTLTPSKTTTTLYLGGSVFQNDTLQFISDEEGRIRWAKHYYTTGDSAYAFEHDYFLKDHLGNVRMVLTEEKDTAQYMATMEATYRSKEAQLFSNMETTGYPAASVPGGYPTDNTTVPNDSVARVNGSGPKIGPGIVLKVMSGDVVDIVVKSFYRSQGSAGGNSDPTQDILNSLAGGIVSITGGAKGSFDDLSNSGGTLAGALNSFRTADNPDPTGKPKAYLNWILVDEQFNYVSAGSGAQPVGNADVLNTLGNTGITMPKNGYLYIYVSNETQNWDVFFDNLSVQHRSGPMMEETHYYPFGLAMAGISSRALKSNYYENHKQFNGIEHTTDLDLNEYDAFYRTLDPQLARFWQIDPKIENAEAWSPYSAMLDNAIRYSDPLGDSGIAPKVVGTVRSVAATTSATLLKSAQVRKSYINKVSKLSPTDSKGRTVAKIEAREKTPTVTKKMAERMRPMSEEKNRVGGTANKTNPEVNTTVENFEVIGKATGVLAVGISTYNVVTSDNKPKAAAEEGGALAGAIVGGELGAKAGAAIGVWFGGAGAVPGAIIGGFVGSIIGGIIGHNAGDEAYDQITK